MNGVGTAPALRAEWLKFRTVRSTAWSLLLLVGVSVLFTAFVSAGSSTMGGSPGRPGDNDLVLESLSGLWFGQIAAAVLAVLVITSEYGTGMIRTSLAADPRRRTLLGAKAAVVGPVVLVVGLATSTTCFLIGQQLFRGGGFVYENGYPAISLADGEAFRAVVGSAAYLGLLAIFALGVGAILRHTAGAITVVLAVILAPVIAIGFLPEHIAEHTGEGLADVRRARAPADGRPSRQHPALPGRRAGRRLRLRRRRARPRALADRAARRLS